MIVHELEQILLEELGYIESPEFIQGAQIPWPGGRAIPEVHAALFLKNIPIAYFSRLSELDPTRIHRLHKQVWSQSRAPLLFVTLPHEIRIYNGYETSPLEGEALDAPSRLLQHLDALTDELTARQKIQQQLVEQHYERIYLETGAFWDTIEGQRINYQHRADQLLISGMKQMRMLLTQAGLSNHIAYTLLGRSIFIRYLEDRGVLTTALITDMTDGQAHSYRDALADHAVTYRLFERLSERFNGDLFPIEADEENVSPQHLDLLQRFLERENLETGQLSLFPFDFEYIPIELISHIYDTFIEDQRGSGAYYTPLLLADFILEETMGADVIEPEMTIFDPACGSGIFLVGAYRRLIQAWRESGNHVTPADLNRILTGQIVGCDLNPEAVCIAAFSLYLEILNHLTSEQIQDDSFRFPSLQKTNLLVSDFFDEERVDDFLATRQFDRIVGNLPWGKNTLTKSAAQWLSKQKQLVGGKQAAPAFMLRVPKYCEEDGEIALLAPAKSTIFVTSSPHRTFRENFFCRY
ncbi:MAG: N-6 DNA methylase, partial [Caldilineaceae bacterium]|nr:N-6 DNA methylase [Caldilineaceae bacterium]